MHSRFRFCQLIRVGLILHVALCYGSASSALAQDEQLNRDEIPQTSAQTAGRFGFGWNGKESGIYLPADARVAQSPLTVEMWVKADQAEDAHIFIANGMRLSGDHWEIGSRRKSGTLYARLGRCLPDEFDTNFKITDGKWHYIALTWDERSVKLFADNVKLVDQPTDRSRTPAQPAGLSLGTRTDERKLTEVYLDDVRLSNVAREIVAAPEQPLIRDAHTIELWNFEESRNDYLARWTPGGETNQPHLPYPHQIAQYEVEGEADWIDGRWQETDKGPFLSHSFLIEGREMGAKLAAVFLAQQTTLVFDTRACSFTAALTESELKINPARFGILAKPRLTGNIAWHIPPRKTWVRQAGSFEFLPLDSELLDYQRLYLNGEEVVFEYLVDGTRILEHASNRLNANSNQLRRRWQIEPHKKSGWGLTLAEGLQDVKQVESTEGQAGTVEFTGRLEEKQITWRLLKPQPDSDSPVSLIPLMDKLLLIIGPNNETLQIELLIGLDEPEPKTADPLSAEGAAGEHLAEVSAAPPAIAKSTASREDSASPVERERANRELPSLAELITAGTKRWGEPLATIGQLGKAEENLSYVLDELTVPFDNPFKALFFISGVDFFPNGDAAVCTVHGDVWIVRGIDEKLSNLRWQRFATGLYQPLGLRIWQEEVIVICRDQIVRLEDTNRDGEADVYHALNHDLVTYGGDHAYAMRLEQDQAGNLYFLKSSEGPPHGASLLRWNRDRNTLEVIAKGFRHPYGLGLGPQGELTVADNEGNWVPSSKIDWIEPGNFYGFIEYQGQPETGLQPERPLCFIPKFIDNSSGGQVWVPPNSGWGCYHHGEMLHLSWGRCTLHAVLRQQVGSSWQAATVRFPELVFRSGSGTANFHPVDGQLYVVGLDGWQTGAVQDGCFTRVRATAIEPLMPKSFEVFPNGIRVGYQVDLDPHLNLDPARYSAEHWNYRWSSEYGSFHYKPSQAGEIGHDELTIDRINLIDNRTIFVHISDLKPVDQIQLNVNLVAQDGRQQSHQILGTINALPEMLEVASATSPEPDLSPKPDLFAMENLVAWCLVPFDAAKRGPSARAEMLRELGFTRFAYDWREEHVATWDQEIEALKAEGVELTAFWAPANSQNPIDEPHWQQIFQLIDRHELKMQLWVMLNEGLLTTLPDADRAKVAARWLKPLAEALRQRQCQLALYNHGGWSGHPDNLVAIAKALRDDGLENVGIVYNLHHAHHEISNLVSHLKAMRPFLMCVNLNGMRADGPKILTLGQGDDDSRMLEQIVQSGYRGLIGILDHQEERDSQNVLTENLENLRRLQANEP